MTAHRTPANAMTPNVEAIEPDRRYSIEEAARILRLSKWTVYKIDRSELEVTKVGPSKRLNRYLGSDLVRYIEGPGAWRYEGNGRE